MTEDGSKGGPRLPVWTWLVVWMAVWAGVPVATSALLYGTFNGGAALLAIFLAINILVCSWEISLGARITDIERWHHAPEAAPERPRGSLYFVRVTPRELLSTRLWARVWYEYAYLDPSYADRKSFGFAIDVGNGWSTLVPSLVFLFGMTIEIMPPVALGLLGALIFWQKFYCTCLYFFTYFFNRRYVGHSFGRVLAAVGGSNGIWLVFPAIGLWICLQLIFEGSYSVIHG